MTRLVDVTVENVLLIPAAAVSSVFWEVAEDPPPVDPRFQKEEWISSTLLQWGPCAVLALEEEEAPAVAYAQYGAPRLFPRLDAYPAGRCSADAVYLAYCYVEPEYRGRGLGSRLVGGVAAALARRGVRALECLGERMWSGGWVLPAAFLEANGFTVVRPDPYVPLLRLDVEPTAPAEAAAGARVGLADR